MKINFNNLIKQITLTDNSVRNYTVKSIDNLLTIRNWLIGYYIMEYEQEGLDRAKYGEKLEENIAKSLNQKGLSGRNLKLFKQFYNVYPQIMQTVSALFEMPMMQTLSAQFKLKKYEGESYVISSEMLIKNISFSHFVELIKIGDTTKRMFYEMQIIQNSLSVRELKKQINSLTFERSALSKNPSLILDSINKNEISLKPKHIIKTSYVFDFLQLPDDILASESKLENALLVNLKSFMLELGNGFCFEAQQKRIVIGGEYYFIDLVFYNRILKCHVLIELKVDEFSHYNIGQLNTYLQYFKKNIQQTTDNPPIGILLCTNKNKELVEYALGGIDNNLFVSEYQINLPTHSQLEMFLKNQKEKFKNRL